jgi:hypothetical protein
MMRLLAILMCVLFLSGFGWFGSVDCEDVVDAVYYNEGSKHLNKKEKELYRRVYDLKKANDRNVPGRAGWQHYYNMCEIWKD